MEGWDPGTITGMGGTCSEELDVPVIAECMELGLFPEESIGCGREDGSLLARRRDRLPEEGGFGAFFVGGATENSLGWKRLVGGGIGPGGAGTHPRRRSLGIGMGKVSMGILGSVLIDGIGGGSTGMGTNSGFTVEGAGWTGTVLIVSSGFGRGSCLIIGALTKGGEGPATGGKAAGGLPVGLG